MIEPLLHNLSIVLVILVPAVTMRAFAEEKRVGTYELLLTAPVRTGEIVAGKFIAASAFMLIMIATCGNLPADPDWLRQSGNRRDGLGIYRARRCWRSRSSSIGLFTSSMTQNQIIAAIAGFGALLMLFVISWPAQTGAAGWSSGVLRYLSITEHFSQMVTGIIDTQDLVYFLSLIIVALFLTQRAVESARWR